MKKFIITIAILAALAATTITAYHAGIRHAIEDSEIFTVTCYDPDNPDDSTWGQYDQLIFIDLDGMIYEHGMWQG